MSPEHGEIRLWKLLSGEGRCRDVRGITRDGLTSVRKAGGLAGAVMSLEGTWPLRELRERRGR